MDTGTDRADAVLAHYGIPGMKWGRRKNASGGYDSTGRKAEASSDHVESRTLKKQPVKTLSNKQIQTINTRLQLESNLSRLKVETNVLTRGEKLAKTGLAIAGTAGSIYGLAKSPAGKAVGEIIKAKLKG